ncbi:GAF and ANTAR domain-containing protein [Lentzea sp.]|uniref:GAF and ANTAR domain-containing protein n=1 Tax=Lentzea sp. TaxID=56099 RepID=UPI002CD4D560|nr:GAF and ANTAR domain-containing protein [Lentzea sp.]HUQ59339.1 GAF and ANTAR domain-containing protein [Lentzea sp.]
MDEQRRDGFIEQVLKCRTASGRAELGQALSAVCVRALPDVDGAALVFYIDSRAQELVGASDPWAAGIEEAQYTLGEGPGFAVVAARAPVLVPDLSVDEVRWPVFAGAARGEGLAAAFLFPLQVGAILLGTLGLYRRRPGVLPAEFVSEATLLADLVAHKLLLQNQRMGQEERIWLETSYQDVSMATGMLAVLLQISLEDAFLRLRAHAFAAGRSVLDVARDVLDRTFPLDRLTD